MDNIFRRASEGAGFGSVIGTAVGTLLTGVSIVIAGTTIVLAPVAAATAVTVSCGAVGTLIGSGVGAVYGASENARGYKKDVDV